MDGGSSRDDVTPTASARIVFCGDGGVGKTTLKMALHTKWKDADPLRIRRWATALYTTMKAWPADVLQDWIVHDLGCAELPPGFRGVGGKAWLAMGPKELAKNMGEGNEEGKKKALEKMLATRKFLRGYPVERPPDAPYAALLAIPHVWTEAVDLSEWRIAKDRTVSLMDFQPEFFPSEMSLGALGAVVLAVYDARKTTDTSIAHLSEWLGLLCSGMPDVVEERCRPTVILVATHSDVTVGEPTSELVLHDKLSAQPCFASQVTLHPDVFSTLYHEPDGGGLHKLRALLTDLTSKSTDLPLPYAGQRDSILSLLHDPDRPHIKAWPVVGADDPGIDYRGQEQSVVLGVLEDHGVIKQLDGARILIKPFEWLNWVTSALLRPGVDPSVRLYGATPGFLPLVSAKTVLRLINERGRILNQDMVSAAEVLSVLGQLQLCFEIWGTEDAWVIPALLPVVPEELGDLQPILQLGAFIGRRYTLNPASRLLRFPPSFISTILDNMQRALCGGAGGGPLKGKVLLLRRRCIVLDLILVRLRVTLTDSALDVVATCNDGAVPAGEELLEPALHLASLAVAVASMQRKVQLLQHLLETTGPSDSAVQLLFGDRFFLLQPAEDFPRYPPEPTHKFNQLLQDRLRTSYATLFAHDSQPNQLLAPLGRPVTEAASDEGPPNRPDSGDQAGSSRDTTPPSSRDTTPPSFRDTTPPPREATDPRLAAHRLAALQRALHVLALHKCDLIATVAGADVNQAFQVERSSSSSPGVALAAILQRQGLLTPANMTTFLTWLEVAGFSSETAPVVRAARALQAYA